MKNKSKNNSCMGKLRYFKSHKQAVHITTKDKRFFNGEIFELNPEEDFVVLLEIDCPRASKVIIKFNEISLIRSFVSREEMEALHGS